MNEYSDWTLEEFNAFKKGLAIPTSIRRHTSDNQNNEESFRRSLLKLYQDRFHERRLKRNLQERFRNRGLSEDWFRNQFDEGDDEGKREDNDNNNGKRSTAGFDWRTKNVVSSIKDQGQCGSCYSFATTEVMESAYAIKKKSTNVTTFSPQQIVDCSSGNYGCNGGYFVASVNYLSSQGDKIATAASYPYAGVQEACKTANINEIQLGNIVYTPIAQGNEEAMATALVNSGPMYIAINANTEEFMYYSAGVLDIENCANGPYDLDHAVVVVGYGYDSVLKMSYWIVRNSWGIYWGENGYVRIAKDAGNMCGVATGAYETKLT
jgi:C1A family cysteine protease